MSSHQLDILALEPFFGGGRRLMLETLIRYSRHRWTLLKLPPRRMERRLSAAAAWFSEQLSRHWVGPVDLVFSSEAMNLAELMRLVPALARKPVVVYYHSNQMPEPGTRHERPHDLTNLNTAAVADEMWFNSVYHLKRFFGKAAWLVERHSELSSRSPLPEMMAKSHVMPPPLDVSRLHEAMSRHEVMRRKRTIFLDTREAHAPLINTAFRILDRRGEGYNLITVGPLEEVDAKLPRRTVSEYDDAGQIAALHEAGIVLSTKLDATDDHHVTRALAAGAWPVAPAAGVYLECLPEEMHTACLYDPTPDHLVSRLQDVWHLGRADAYRDLVRSTVARLDSVATCRKIDDRLAEVAARRPSHR